MASIAIDQVVFEPKTLKAFMAEYAIAGEIGHDVTIEAANQIEVQALLAAVLANWIDFVFIPREKSFAIYADHDEFMTFYANEKSILNQITNALSTKGFEIVEDFERKFSVE